MKEIQEDTKTKDALSEEISESFGEEEESESSEELQPMMMAGKGGQWFKSFVPNAEVQEEDSKKIEKVRDAGYTVPKVNIIESYQKLREHFISKRAEEAEESRRHSEMIKFQKPKPRYSEDEAALKIQGLFKLKMKRDKEKSEKLNDKYLTFVHEESADLNISPIKSNSKHLITLAKEQSIEQTGRFRNIQREQLNKQDMTNLALSKMYPADKINLELEPEEAPLLHNELILTPETPKIKRSVIYNSSKEMAAILLLQSMVRVSRPL